MPFSLVPSRKLNRPALRVRTTWTLTTPSVPLGCALAIWSGGSDGIWLPGVWSSFQYARNVSCRSPTTGPTRPMLTSWTMSDVVSPRSGLSIWCRGSSKYRWE